MIRLACILLSNLETDSCFLSYSIYDKYIYYFVFTTGNGILENSELFEGGARSLLTLTVGPRKQL